jgi:hypothetical protein
LDTILFLSKTGSSAIDVKKAFLIFEFVFAEISKNNKPSLPANFSASLVSTFLLNVLIFLFYYVLILPL